MPLHKLKLIECNEIARDTFLFVFDKPVGFTFKPGQYGGFTLINPSETDAGGITRRFSLLSIPDDSTITIATRMQNSAYKRVLKNLPIGNEIKFAGPTGNFTLHEDADVPAVLIAGGIGITPFYSMIRDATLKHATRKITLFYGNQSTHDAAFLKELRELEAQNANLQCIVALAQPDASWIGETGYISHSMIKKYVPDLTLPIFYVCGSPAMVTALRDTLNELDIPEERIRVEDFPGY